MKKLKWLSAVTNKSWIWLFMLLLAGTADAQNRLSLKNPSFEDSEQGPHQVPVNWKNIGNMLYTAPDILPGSWEVTMPAQHGKNYLGLVVRDNNTVEGVGQKLQASMQKDSTYEFSVCLARSSKWRGATPKSNGEILTYSAPTILKIWGYNTVTKNEEFLALSEPVGVDQWVKYVFTLKPLKDNYNQLELMVSHAPGFENKNGNLMIDNCSDIIMVHE